MANSTSAIPACQRCKSPSVTPLVKEGDRQRFECSRCDTTFWGPALVGVPDPAAQTSAPTAFVPIAIPERTAGPAGTCGRCGKPYLRLGKKYDQHIAVCDGKTPYVAPKPRARRKPIDGVLPPSAAEIYTRSLAALRARKAALEAEVRGIDSAILEIEEKLKGAGGPPQAPFVDGSRPIP